MTKPAITLPRDVIFDEAEHVYTIKESGRRLTPVTTLLERFFPQFDGPKMAERCSRGSNPKYRGRSPRAILQEWEANSKRAREEGSLVHADIASFLNGEIAADEHKSPMFPEWYRWWREEPLEPILAEALLYDAEIGVAGQSDLIGWCPRSHTVVIADWKTSKEITRENRYGDRGFGPLAHLPKANLVEYTLQVSMYALLLERMTGLRPDRGLIINLRGGVRVFPTKIMRKEAESVFAASGAGQ